ncbi:hypothetical protein [Beijerinckia sp. L45]|uniref:hypothetical protein n=1 Tax=Beijerinckia sp. L45 TaxID=1641855 RepID=UPI00131D61F7|nr:hypothetical protein [Beijerinckia sp. L45]
MAHLCDLCDLEGGPGGADLDEAVVASLSEQLRLSGYRTVPVNRAVIARISSLRSDYDGRFRSLSDHLGADRAVLTPDGHR